MENAAGKGQDKPVLVLAEQLFPILKEADDDNHSRPRKANKEHRFKQPHGEDGKLHEYDCSVFSAYGTAVCVPWGGIERRHALENASRIYRGRDDS